MAPESIVTRVLAVDPDVPQPEPIRAAAEVLLAGGLVAFPTETVYGLGANARDAAAVGRIFAAKGRPASDPIIVHIASLGQLDEVAEHVPTLARRLAQEFWPGPLTLVLRRPAGIPANVSAGLPTVAVRMPQHQVALALARAAGTPIAAPSANLFARPSPTTAQHVLDDLRGRIDVVLDGGPTPIGLESTVLDLTRDPPALLRPGGVSAEALRALIPDLHLATLYLASAAAGAPEAAASPGMLVRHYSPRAELLLFGGSGAAALARMRATARRFIAAGKAVGILTPDEECDVFGDLPAHIVRLGPQGDMAEIGRRLFAGMRELDAAGVAVILVRGVPREGMGLAIWDRLFRAAEGRVIDADADDPG